MPVLGPKNQYELSSAPFQRDIFGESEHKIRLNQLACASYAVFGESPKRRLYQAVEQCSKIIPYQVSGQAEGMHMYTWLERTIPSRKGKAAGTEHHTLLIVKEAKRQAGGRLRVTQGSEWYIKLGRVGLLEGPDGEPFNQLTDDQQANYVLDVNDTAARIIDIAELDQALGVIDSEARFSGSSRLAELVRGMRP